MALLDAKAIDRAAGSAVYMLTLRFGVYRRGGRGDAMEGYILIASVLVLGAIGAKLSNDALKYLHDPNKTYFYSVIFDREAFKPEGEALRRRAVRFYNRASIAIVILMIVLTWLSRR